MRTSTNKAVAFLERCLVIVFEYYIRVDQERVFRPLLNPLEVWAVTTEAEENLVEFLELLHIELKEGLEKHETWNIIGANNLSSNNWITNTITIFEDLRV